MCAVWVDEIINIPFPLLSIQLLLTLVPCQRKRQRSKRVTRTTKPSQTTMVLQAPNIQWLPIAKQYHPHCSVKKIPIYFPILPWGWPLWWTSPLLYVELAPANEFWSCSVHGCLFCPDMNKIPNISIRHFGAKVRYSWILIPQPITNSTLPPGLPSYIYYNFILGNLNPQ